MGSLLDDLKKVTSSPEALVLGDGVQIVDSVDMSKYNNTILVEGTATIKAPCPIIFSGTLYIKGTENSTLNLIATSPMQPCMGGETDLGLSGGRWSIAREDPEKIIVDGVRVICESKTDNFTLGCYGCEGVPKLVLENNGLLKCPEMTGERVVSKWVVAPDGSTKIYGSMEYAIKLPSTSDLELLPEDVQEYYKAIKNKYHELPSIHLGVTVEALKVLEKLLEYDNTLDVSYLLSGKERKNFYCVANAIILGMPVEDTPFWEEATFEATKMRFIWSNILKNENEYNVDKFEEQLTEYFNLAIITDGNGKKWRYFYEMIPAYWHDFENRGYKGEVASFVRRRRPRSIEDYDYDYESKSDYSFGGAYSPARIIADFCLEQNFKRDQYQQMLDDWTSTVGVDHHKDYDVQQTCDWIHKNGHKYVR